MATLEFFHPALIELQKEILTHHPVLAERLTKHHDTDPELQLAKCYAEIGSFCNVALDDIYTPADMIKLADIFIERLRARRASNLGISTKPIVVEDSKIIIH